MPIFFHTSYSFSQTRVISCMIPFLFVLRTGVSHWDMCWVTKTPSCRSKCSNGYVLCMLILACPSDEGRNVLREWEGGYFLGVCQGITRAVRLSEESKCRIWKPCRNAVTSLPLSPLPTPPTPKFHLSLCKPREEYSLRMITHSGWLGLHLKDLICGLGYTIFSCPAKDESNRPRLWCC